MAVLERLEQHRDFTESELDIARFVLANADEATHLSINELAARTYSSNATIVRLCRKLGLSGYREFRIQLTSELERKRVTQSDVDINYPFKQGETSNSIASKLATLSQEAIRVTYAMLDFVQLQEVAKKIALARMVHLWAVGDSQVSGLAFGNQLVNIGVPFANAFGYGNTGSYVYLVQPNDIALLISYSGRLLADEKVRRAISTFNVNKCPVVLLSTMEKAPGVDYVIQLPSSEDPIERVSSYYSQESVRFVLNTLYGIAYNIVWSEGGYYAGGLRHPLVRKAVR